jgi:hypothetical protein
MLKTITEFSLMLSLVSLMLGCGGGPPAPKVPKIDAAASATAAMADYDTNKDGFIDQAELKNAPSLKEAEKVIDSNSDGKLSRDEIEQRLNKYSAQGMALISFSCSVTMDGAKKDGIEVEMVPERFMLGIIKIGKGNTDANGMVRFKQEGQEFEGVAPGFYKIKLINDGSLSLPARFNENTAIGKEIALDRMGRGGDSFDIKASSK